MKKFLTLAVILSFVLASTVGAEVKTLSAPAMKTDNVVKAPTPKADNTVKTPVKKSKKVKPAPKPVTAKPVVKREVAATPTGVKAVDNTVKK